LFVAGGRQGTQAVAQIWQVDPATAALRPAGHLPLRFSDAATVVVGQRAWLIGGETVGPTSPLSSVVVVE
jgi:hypothetical protein